MNKRKTGAEYEAIAAEYLTQNGMKITERNFRNRQGEIDLIGYHDGYLVFVEVKYRQNEEKGNPVEAVTYYKQKQICKVADYYRYIHKIDEYTAFRYDVVAICGDEITWYQNAFEHIQTGYSKRY